MTVALATLNPAARVTLADCEQRIERALNGFVDMGQALTDIRDGRLYKATHGTFEAYCQERWDIGRDYADRMIAAAQVVLTIVSKGLPAPTKESQARALVAVPEPERADVWREAVERTGGKPTAKAITEVVAERTQIPGPVDAADCPPADPGATPEPAAHPSWPTESELKPWETLAPPADRIAESMEPIADDPRDRTHGAEFESYDAAEDVPPVPPPGSPATWTPEQVEANRRETQAKQIRESGIRLARDVVSHLSAEISTIVDAFDLGERDLITSDLIAELHAQVDRLAARIGATA
jgi:hypothetical protein